MNAWESIKVKLFEMIENEDKAKPLSDEEVAERFNSMGCQIAWRTITQYRQILGIQSPRKRRDLPLPPK
jgi:RNA polymerase sigma-54 factor